MKEVQSSPVQSSNVSLTASTDATLESLSPTILPVLESGTALESGVVVESGVVLESLGAAEPLQVSMSAWNLVEKTPRSTGSDSGCCPAVVTRARLADALA